LKVIAAERVLFLPVLTRASENHEETQGKEKQGLRSNHFWSHAQLLGYAVSKHGVSSWLKVAKTIRPSGRFEQKGEGSGLN
jgi:hypothetical protein